MAKTVDAAFTQYFDAINLSGDHREIANKRRDALVSILSKNFKVVEAFAFGSIPKFTALKGHADVDVMVALDPSLHINGKSPKEVLQSVRDVLGQYRTNVRKNGQAVTLYYESWPNVDIVPARLVSNWLQTPYYEIPNIVTGTWIATNPKTHRDAVEAKSNECGPNLRRIMKLVKHWNLTHGNYLSGYHVEVIVLRSLVGRSEDLGLNLHRVFEKGSQLLKSPMFHELSVVDGYLLSPEREEVVKRWERATYLAGAAWYADYPSNGQKSTQKAIETWRQLFGTDFPEFG